MRLNKYNKQLIEKVLTEGWYYVVTNDTSFVGFYSYSESCASDVTFINCFLLNDIDTISQQMRNRIDRDNIKSIIKLT
jgi:hypothetical protein